MASVLKLSSLLPERYEFPILFLHDTKIVFTSAVCIRSFPFPPKLTDKPYFPQGRGGGRFMPVALTNTVTFANMKLSS